MFFLWRVKVNKNQNVDGNSIINLCFYKGWILLLYCIVFIFIIPMSKMLTYCIFAVWHKSSFYLVHLSDWPEFVFGWPQPPEQTERRKLIQVSHAPGCAWSSSSLASCNYCTVRARPLSVSTELMDNRGSRAERKCVWFTVVKTYM